MGLRVPRLMVTGLSGDAGKTVVSLAVLAGLRQRGRSVTAFKKGPDYIDAAWLGAIAEKPCRNLDTFMASAEDVKRRFVEHAASSGVAVIEGNRGLFDGMDAQGTHSSAALAALLETPVILVVNTTKSTRTQAALIRGCQEFDRKLNIAGVVLNHVAGKRHETVIREAIEEYCHLPVVGAIPKLGEDAAVIPGRHLGLVTPAEYGSRSELDTTLVRIADEYLDIDRILSLAEAAPDLDIAEPESGRPTTAPRARIAYFKDAVFTFYYPENLEALESNGAELVPLSALDDTSLPGDVHGLYIGGGFPETQAARLSANRSLMVSVKQAAEDGLAIYAECGGLIYLCRSLTVGDTSFPMAGLFEIDLLMHRRPFGHGYVEAEVDVANAFFDCGMAIRGHEFHYTGPAAEVDLSTGVSVHRGVGLGFGRDGLVHKSVLACYTHLHADGVPAWAPSFLAAAVRYRTSCPRPGPSGRSNREPGHEEKSGNRPITGSNMARRAVSM